MMKKDAQVLIVGGGIAGLCAAIEARQAGADTLLLCRSKAGYSGNSVISGAGLSLLCSESDYGDSAERFLVDIERSGSGIGEQETESLFVERSKEVLPFLDRNGVRMNGWLGKELALHSPGHSARRTFHPDFTAAAYALRGLTLTSPLLDQAKRLGVRIEDGARVTGLIKDDASGRICGAFVRHDGITRSCRADSVILACGGGASVYGVNNNTSDVSGDAYLLAYEAGAALQDMEMVQFFPCMMPTPVRLALQTPLFGDGAVMRNRLGEAFLERYSPMGNRATRDVMARAAKMEADAGRGKDGCVFLDCSAIPAQVLKNSYALLSARLKKCGYAIERDWIPISPAAHFYMGGIVTNEAYRTRVAGLYACGEAVGGLHGANRLAGNALTEAVISGRTAGLAAAQYAFGLDRLPTCHAETASSGSAVYPYASALKQLGECMWRDASLIREEKGLLRALDNVKEIAWQVQAAGAPALEDAAVCDTLRARLAVAQMLLLSALARKESRGAHYRSDYMETKAEYRGNFIVEKTENGPRISFRALRFQTDA